ncbi:MAG: ATP--guanido phosphotransferase [Omnitrophica WOR_2 bacterium SM23_29]|nr:MAG: ATP--guanido phosphotransferase [Omnitrophica WOR_2 bacterium SM23_29]
MKLDDLLKQTGEWLKGIGPNSEMVMSSRIRLARNLAKYPFPHRADKKQLEDVLSDFEKAYKRIEYFKGALYLMIKDLNALDKQFLIERHLISREHIRHTEYKAVLISDREIISVMVNEEDHLRIQILQSGFNLQDTWQLANKIDEELDRYLDYAYSNELGFLTCCPTNVGTGLRASCMVQLPSLVITKQIKKVLYAITKLGLTARGLYGEGTEAYGNFFQISNQVTLGHSEEEIIDNLERIMRQIIEQENAARSSLLANQRPLFEDMIWRAYGTLKSAHIITSNEAINLLSHVRLGMDLGIIKDIDRNMLNELLIQIQPAHLQKLQGKQLSTHERDVTRAELIRSKFMR